MKAVVFLFAGSNILCLCFQSYETDERARWAKNPTAAGGGNREDFLAQRSKKSSKRAARRFFRVPQEARRDNPKVVGSNPASATRPSLDARRVQTLFLFRAGPLAPETASKVSIPFVCTGHFRKSGRLFYYFG